MKPARDVSAGIRRLDHVAIAANDLSQPLALFVDTLGGRLIAGGDNDQTGTRLIHIQCGGFKLELMQPLRADTPVAARLDKHGPGFHHLTFVVDDLLETIDGLEWAGHTTTGTLLDSPHWRETFIRPRETFGTLVQFVDTDRRWDVPATQYTLEDVVAGKVVWRDFVACLR